MSVFVCLVIRKNNYSLLIDKLTIAVVGIGLDGANGLSQRVNSLVRQATVLVGNKRHLSYFPQHQGQKIYLTNLKAGIDAIEAVDSDNNSVVILASGDPLFFGLGRLLLENFHPDRLEFYPHLSSLPLAFSRLKMPWQDANLISLHGRSCDRLIELLKRGKEKIALLTDSNNHPGAIARLYLSLSLPVNYDFYVCENLGSSQENITSYQSDRLYELIQKQAEDFASLNVLILIRSSQNNKLDLDNLPLIGLPDSSFLSFRDRPSLITKKEIRLAILGELSLQPKQTVWDIGAGTGSVSIEIARLCPTSQIWAVEKTGMGSTLIEQNSQRFAVSNIHGINGKAPAALLNLPQPNRIFIGGSGGNLSEILDFSQDKLLPQGIIVLAFATIEHGYEAINWFKNNSWQYSLLQLQISRSTPLNHLTRFTPLNPVTIIKAYRDRVISNK